MRALTTGDLWALLAVATVAVAVIAPLSTWLTTKGGRR